MAAPVERKVQASTTVAAVSGMALWVLGKYVFKGDVPDVFASWVYVLVPGLLTFAAGYLAKHSPRESQEVRVVYTGPREVNVQDTGGHSPPTPGASEPV